MVAHQIFAVINEEKVKNVMVCDNYYLANQIAKDSYGDEAFAVDCLQYPCGIGDRYVNGVFYYGDSDGAIEPLATEEQEIQLLKEDNEQLKESLTDLQLAITELYEGGTENG